MLLLELFRSDEGSYIMTLIRTSTAIESTPLICDLEQFESARVVL